MEFQSVEEVLDYAIEQERRAARFYELMAGKSADVVARKFFQEMVGEERKHEAKLEAIKSGKIARFSRRETPQMNLTEVLGEPVFREDITLQEGLILAMRAEKDAYEMYTALAGFAGDDALKEILEGLAREELEHKARMENIYDQVVQREN